jgi:hypothetical protein
MDEPEKRTRGIETEISQLENHLQEAQIQGNAIDKRAARAYLTSRIADLDGQLQRLQETAAVFPSSTSS